jgi:uncharacterized caspase-like protein
MPPGGKAALAAAHVLAVGINEYDHQQQLAGAVHDAEDIAETFRRLGASVTLLRNREASRARIEAEWRAILARARSGDTVIFSYAGHGGQEPDKPPLDEEDGLDEAFLLTGFDPDPRHAGFAERILDDTIHDWFEEAGAQGLKVILVADACYSGTMTRGIPDQRAVVALRGSLPYGMPATVTLEAIKQNAAQLTRVAIAPEDDQTHVTLLSATQENRNAPEVVIGGESRGALSYAFARAVEGAADANHDGAISRFELEAYISRQVRQLSEAQQAADVQPRRGNDVTVFELPAGAVPTGANSTALGKIKLRVLGLAPAEAQELVSRLDGVALAAAGEAAELAWDAAAQDAISGIGDPVAHSVSAAGLQGVIDKWRILALLKQRLSTRAVDVRLEPDDSRHVEGSEVAILSEPLEQPYVTVLDISPDGALRLLYPVPSDPPRWPKGRPYRVDHIEVQEPFGADHILLIASDKPLSTLQTSIRTLTTRQLPALLEQQLAGADYRMALMGVYTVSNRESR